MLSVVAHAPGRISVDTVPDPGGPAPDAAVVEVHLAAICGSDLHFYDGDLPLFPVALGHEAVGTVIAVGSEVTRVRVGDRVMVSSVAGCGACPGCATSDPVRCRDGAQVFGSGALGGAQSELLAVPAADFNLLTIPDGVDDEAALLLTDNLATGWVGAQRAAITPGDDVLVLGLGAVGLCAVRAALAQGAGRVLAADPVAGRRERATEFGAVPVEGDTPETVLGAVLERTEGLGVDSVIDAVATDASLNQAFGAVRAAGTISVIGVHNLDPYPLPVLMGVFRSISLQMTTAPVQRTWADLVPRVTDRRIRTDGIFTHSYDLADAAEAYAAVAARSAEVVKAVLRMPAADRAR
ncbi:alcohol dehydrogenase catalytic domain-containing protein [Nocardioides sp. R-C-SC26]|uniref:alcohol dehydrogenase catalytic domain-containing protein n=1 Tax=Nocardioides sp. R-C-SC26 TaxID=2870414 RepID=UPI001E39B6E5|nr:alcohol dehydrogenase catalytic domain-containing protein [Nocardioides sp. R-C-SC26]